MPLKFPQIEIPKWIKGGSDIWDTPAGSILLLDFFDQVSGGTLKIKVGGVFISIASQQTKVSGVFQTVSSKIKSGGSFI